MPPAEDARVALAAYTLLKVDIGWLSKKSAKWMRDSAGGIPFGFVEVGADPVVRLLDSPAGSLGFVLFPEGPTQGKSPTPAQQEAVLAAARPLKGKVALIIGISPWGFVGERDFLAKAEGVFDCILGSGEGVGFPGTVPQKAPGVLWVRPDGAGRAVNILELYFTPRPGEKTPWVERKSFSSNLEFLDQTCPADPAVQRIIGPGPKSEEAD